MGTRGDDGSGDSDEEDACDGDDATGDDVDNDRDGVADPADVCDLSAGGCGCASAPSGLGASPLVPGLLLLLVWLRGTRCGVRGRPPGRPG